MSITELISTISVCVTAIIAIAAFIVPIIINSRNNQRTEKQHATEMQFKEKQLKAEKLYNEQKLEAEKRYNEQKLEAEKKFNEQKLEAEREYQRKKYEFDKLFEEQFKIINDFDNAFSEWKISHNNEEFIRVICKTSALLKNEFTRYDFDRLVKRINEKDELKKIQSSYEHCRNIIFEFLGLESSNGSNDLVKDQLQKAICKKLNFNPY